MILLLQSSQEYNNDLRAMIMAFFPGIKIVGEQDEKQEYLFTFVARYGDEFSTLSIGNDEITVEGDFLDKKEFRNKLKKASYHLLCKKNR